MKKLIIFIYAALCVVSLNAQDKKITFSQWFDDATLRVDYIRTGNLRHDTCILHRFARQNDHWAGSLTQLLDPIDNGEYRIVVKDAKTGRELYSRCYNTLFEEYRFTIASRLRDSVASFEEVMLVPFPKNTVDICLQKRDRENRFFTSATFRFNPKETAFASLQPSAEVVKLLDNGDIHKKIDVVIVAEGYGKKDRRKMREDFDKFTTYLLGQEPFKSRADDFNVWGVGKLMEQSGVSDPGKNRYVESAVSSSYNTFNMDRYLMTTHLFKLHDLLAGVNYDHIIIMANCDTYGGGAIYNYYAFSAVQNMSMWILPHELGHSIGGLADEYVENDTNYNQRYVGREPVEPNITSLVDFDKKWASLVPAGTPIPTPPVEGLGQQDNGPVGAYEGAGYLATGCFRPCTQCMMRNYADFCPVCMKRMNEVFDLYIK